MTHTRKWLLLSLLEAAGKRGVTTAEILTAGVGSRYGARIAEIREAGYTIESVRERDGSWRYTLLNSPEASPSEPQLSSDPDNSTYSTRTGPMAPIVPAATPSLFGITRAKGTLGYGEEEFAA